MTADSQKPNRRTVLTGAAIGGTALVGGVAGGVAGAASRADAWKRERVTFDVACLGDTWRDVVPRNPASGADFRLPFLVEGWIYPSGTVLDGFVPTNEGSIGRWFCQGWLILDGNRPQPHVSSRQVFVLGQIVPEDLFPTNNLVTAGIEGTDSMEQSATRAVIGGTGDYLAASGQVTQWFTGTNTTILDDGTGNAALNFRMDFDLLLPNI